MRPTTGHPFDRSPTCCMVCHTVVTLEDLKAGAAVAEGKWLRVGQVAKLLEVSVGTARNYFDAGVFRKTRRLRGGDRQVWSTAVDEYLRRMQEDREFDNTAPASPTTSPDPES